MSVTLLAILLLTSVQAQGSDGEPLGLRLRNGGVADAGGGVIYGGRHGVSQRVDFFSTIDPTSRQYDDRYASIWIMTRRDVPGTSRVMWLDSKTCPAALGVLADFEDIVAPSFIVNNLGPVPLPPEAVIRLPPKMSPLHAPSYRVWGRAMTPDRAFSRMTIDVSFGLVAEWAEFAKERLEPCWSTTPPDYVEPSSPN